MGCPWGQRESDMTERLTFHFLPSLIKGRVSESPLQNVAPPDGP